MSINEIVDWI